MVILPGEYVGTIEEYAPSFGVYSDRNKLFSSNIGELALDKKTHAAKVTCKTRIPKMQNIGVITLGAVADASENVALIDLLPFESKSFYFVPQEITAVLHISNIRRGYTKNMRDQVRIGDIIRVKIIELERCSVRLTTDGRDLGVVLAFCSNCRHRLEMSGRMLVCKNCGSRERRKTAYDYGSGRLR